MIMIDLLGGNIKALGIHRYPYYFPKQALHESHLVILLQYKRLNYPK